MTMKYDFINKYQNGGGMIFTSYTPTPLENDPTPPPRQAPAKQEPKKKEDYLKYVTKLMENIDGLPIDVEIIKQKANQFVDMIYALQGGSANPYLNLGDTDQGPDPKMIARAYVELTSDIKKATYNKAKNKAAYDRLKEIDGLSEINIDETGRIIAYNDKGKLTQITSETYLKNRDKYKALTNGQLIQMRAHNSMNNLLNYTAANATSTTLILQQIKNNFNKLGKSSDSLSETLDIPKDVANGTQVLRKLMSLGYDVKELIRKGGLKQVKGVTETLKQLAELAISYLWSGLTPLLKQFMKVKFGGSEEAVKYISSYVASGMSSKSEIEIKNLKDNEQGKGKKGKKDKEEEGLNHNITKPEAILNGYGRMVDTVLQFGGRAGYRVKGTEWKINPIPPTDTEGHELKGLSIVPISNVLKSQDGVVLDSNNVQFGNNKVDDINMTGVFATSDTMRIVSMPITQRSDGSIKIDFTKLKKIEAATDELNLDPQIREFESIDSVTEINKLKEEKPEEAKLIVDKINSAYHKLGLPPKYIERNGHYILNKEEYRRFAMLAGLGTKAVVDTDNLVAEERLTDKQKGYYENAAMVNQITGYDATNWWNDDFYKSNIFIPIREGAHEEAAYAAGKEVKSLELNERSSAIYTNKKRQNFNPVTS